jgi:lipid A ethanolaminephosphotransferase
MIVDESIRGDFLQINTPSEPSTPFLATLGERLINFRNAVSGHNCSAAARLILRSDLREADLPDRAERALKAPTIWQYAHKAGYQTVLIDAFAEVSETHSYMTKAERAFIDRAIPVDDEPAYRRDQTIATRILPEVLADKEPQFVYVNKFGAHFPYHTKYPPGFDRDGGPMPEDNLDDRKELLESYRRAVKWSVDTFFRELLGRITLADTLILYTSDHGQSLLDGGYKQTHCSTGRVPAGEGIVPLFAFAGDGPFRQRLLQEAQTRHDRATHFDLFPTMLLAMGYDPAWVARRYPASLLDLPADRRRRFLTGDMFGTGLGGKWIEVK